MKSLNGFMNGLKIIVKYGALIAVALKVIEFAHDEFAKVLDEKEPKKDVKDVQVVSEPA